MKLHFPTDFQIDGTEFSRPDVNDGSEYAFRICYHFTHPLSNESCLTLAEYLQGEYGRIAALRVHFRGDAGILTKEYSGVAAYKSAERPAGQDVTYVGMDGDIDIDGYSLMFDLDNRGGDAHEQTLPQEDGGPCTLRLEYRRPIPHTGPPVPGPETEYYLCENRLVMRVMRENSFYCLDPVARLWRYSDILWNDYYGWDGWGEDAKTFHKLDMEDPVEYYLREIAGKEER